MTTDPRQVSTSRLVPSASATETGVDVDRHRDDVASRAAHDADLAGLRARGEGRGQRGGADATSTPLVRAVGLTKRYLGTTVLDDVSLTVESGEIVGLVGPNGAGKTTLLRILATLTSPDRGSATVCGFDLADTREVRACIGFMPDVLGVYDDMLVREYLEFFARAHHLPPATRDYAIDETLALVGLKGMENQPVDGLSRGLKQRLGLARALQHGPRLLLLDEPASGLDPLARLELREILRRTQRRGTSVIISSHVLEDLADICTRVAIIRRGRLECMTQTAQLITDKGGRRVRVKAAAREEEMFSFLGARTDVDGLRWDADCVIFRMAGADEASLAALLTDLVRNGFPVVRFSEEQSTLETAYLNVTSAGEGWEDSTP